MKKTRINLETLSDRIDYLLINSGAHLIPRAYYTEWPSGARAFEDAYTILGVWTFESFEALAETWMTAQDAMIQLVSSNVLGTDSKAWDGYLILTTGGSVPTHLLGELNAIRFDTRRLRKLVVTADDLQVESTPDAALKSIRRALAPVIEVSVERSNDSQDPLETLPQRLETESKQLLRDLQTSISAYKRGIPAIENLVEIDEDRGWVN
jgi:hypothetical protein